ncbi:MAG TPA: YCF48-related protein [Ignavibacteria bacterium]
MKKALILTILLIINFLLFTDNGFSQSNWIFQSPLPTGNSLMDLKFLNYNTGYACGMLATAIKTTNGGISWISLNPGISTTGPESMIYSLFFNDVTTGYLASTQKILKTTNGGDNWYVVDTGFYSLSGDIFFIDYNIGYIVDSSIIRKTTNGGINWTHLIYPGYKLLSVQFVNTQTGYISGEYQNFGCIGKTTNGGNNWDFQSIINGGGHNLRDIHFLNEFLGYGIADLGSVIKTTNGGLNWNYYDYAGQNPYSIFFINPNTGFTTGYDISKTTNGGVNWINYSLGYWNSTYSLIMVDTITGYAIGGKGLCAKTTNCGNNWNIISSGTSMNVNNLYFLNNNTGFAACDDDILKTTNGGLNWKSLVLFYNIGSICAIVFTDINYGYGLGLDGNIYRTTNCGINWVEEFIAYNTYSTKALYFVNNFTGYICGGSQLNAKSSILKTINNGLNWILIDSSFNTLLLSMKFLNDSIGYASGKFGYIIKTTNAGNYWFQQNSGTFDDIVSVDFPNKNIGYAITCEKVLKTTNGGINWIISSYALADCFNNKLYCVKFINELTGFVGGGYSEISSLLYKTTNGGLNWNLLNTGSFNQIMTITNTNNDTIYIGGFLGAIMKTTNGGSVWIKNISSNVPEKYNLYQNYPNPFNPISIIKYQIAKTQIKNQKVKLIVYNSFGQKIKTLVNEEQSPGIYEVTFDGSNLASGVYFYQLKTEDIVESRKMVLVK